MPEKFYYPIFSEKNLAAIWALYQGAPKEYLTDSSCPYLESTKKFFSDLYEEKEQREEDSSTPDEAIAMARALAMTKYLTKEEEDPDLDPRPMTDDETIIEINSIYRQIKDYGDAVKFSDKSADKNTYFKLSVSLLERMITMKEKMSNIKAVDTFTSGVISIMEDILTTEQRIIVRERLKEFKDKLTAL